MEGLFKLFFTVFTGALPWMSVYAIFGYVASIQEKRAEKRKEERKRGIIRTHYVIKSEIILVIIFTFGTLFFVLCAVLCWLTLLDNIEIINENFEGADMWCVYAFAVFALVCLAGTLNTLIWKLEVNGEEVAWRSTFGIVRRFRFDDITECERRKHSIHVYVNNKKMFHIDDNIDCEEFMEDVKRHGIRETDAFIKKLEKRKGKKRW